MEFLYEYGLFLLKAATVVVALLLIIGGIASAAGKNKPQNEGEIKVRHLSEELKDTANQIKKELLPKEDFKKFEKIEKKELKEKEKKQKRDKNKDLPSNKKRLFVLEFDGDMKASAVEHLREEITTLLMIAEDNDQVLLKLESGGGMVHSYGFAAAQLQRIKESGLKLTIAVDRVAASGGYMMACIGDKIIASPFAILGSIGVIAQIPNFNRLLRKHDIDFEQHTAGEYKRTLTLFGEVSDKGREKFKEEIEDTHGLFKGFVEHHRPAVDINQVATGETWYGQQAIDNNLIDNIQTSDDFIMKYAQENDVYALSYELKKPLAERLGIAASVVTDTLLSRFWSKKQLSELSQ
ncbi:MAG: protease SohB [Pseudomonadota bacterium]